MTDDTTKETSTALIKRDSPERAESVRLLTEHFHATGETFFDEFDADLPFDDIPQDKEEMDKIRARIYTLVSFPEGQDPYGAG